MKSSGRLAGVILLTALSVSEVTGAERAGGTLEILTTQRPGHLNSAFRSGTATAMASAQIFASLIRYGEDWTPQPWLAKSWRVAADGLSVSMELERGVFFHDGEELTSRDVAFSIMAIKENHLFTPLFAPVEAVETPEKHRVIFHFSRPHPAFLMALSPAFAPILPAHIYGGDKDVKTHPANFLPIGAGPFMVESFTPGQSVVLKRFPRYFREGYPELDEIIIRIGRTGEEIMRLIGGDHHAIYPFIDEPELISRLHADERLVVSEKGYEAIGAIDWLAFNLSAEKLVDPRIRKAICTAIDREALSALTMGFARPQAGPVFEKSPFYAAGFETWDGDIAAAKQLLANAGYEEGLSLTLDYIPGLDAQQKPYADYIAARLAEIGVDVRLRPSSDLDEWASRVADNRYDMTLDVVFNWADPVIGVHRIYESSSIVRGVAWANMQRYASDDVDELLEAARREMNGAKRKSLYAEFQRLVAEDAPVCWLTAAPYRIAYPKTLRNPPLGIWGVASPLDEVSWGGALSLD